MDGLGGTVDSGSTFEDIASGVIAELGGPAEGEGSVGDEPTPAAEGGSAEGAPQGAAPEEGGASGTEPEPTDFLAASGVTLEDLLEGIEDEGQRSFLERRYKEMQAGFTRSTQEAARKAELARTEKEQESETLRTRVQQLEEIIARGVQPQQQPEDWRQKFVTQGLGPEVTVEEAVTDPQKLVAFIRQEATKAARESDLTVLSAVDQRLGRVEGHTLEQVERESEARVERVFSQAPEYRTLENEQAMALLIKANPGLTLEHAFEIVVGPKLREDTLRLGQRIGEVQGRKAAGEIMARKQRVSVPSSGATGDLGVELPDKPTFDQIAEFALRTVDRE